MHEGIHADAQPSLRKLTSDMLSLAALEYLAMAGRLVSPKIVIHNEIFLGSVHVS
jgi:hypothetical protein